MKAKTWIKWLGGLSVFYAACGFATTVLPQTLEQLSSRAPLVVHGRIIQIEVDGATGRRTAILEPLEIVKGLSQWKTEREFYLPLANRALPHSDLIEAVPGAPEVRAGEEIVAFLQAVEPGREGLFARTDGHRVFIFQGFQQGRYRVVRDSKGVRRALSWDEPGERRSSPSELRKQKTTPRFRAAQLKTPVDSSLTTDQGKTLDFVLNVVRAAGDSSP